MIENKYRYLINNIEKNNVKIDAVKTRSSRQKIKNDLTKNSNNSSNKFRNINKNNYNYSNRKNHIKVDLNNYKTFDDQKKKSKFINNSQKVETVSIDITNNDGKMYYKKIKNKLSENNNRRVIKNNYKNEKNKLVNKKLNKDEETGSLSTGIEKMNTITNSTNLKSQLNNMLDENKNKTLEISNKLDLNDYNSFENNINKYKILKENKNTIINKTDPNDELKNMYDKNINQVDQIFHFNNKDIKKVINNSVSEFDKSNKNKDNNIKEVIKNNNNFVFVEEIKEKGILSQDNNLKKLKDIKCNYDDKIKKNNELNSDIFISNLEEKGIITEKNETLKSNNSSVEGKFSYENNTLKNLNNNNILDIEYLKKYLNDDNNIINKNVNVSNDIDNGNLNLHSDKNKNIFGREEENIDNRVSSSKEKFNPIENKNNKEENNSNNESLVDLSKQDEHINLNSKNELISNKSSSNYIKNTINNKSNSFKNQNINLINQTEKINNINKNKDIHKKDSLNDNQIEESSHYNMNFYDSRFINIKGINSNVNSDNNSKENTGNKNDKIDKQLNNTSMNNTNNSFNEYNSYYNSFINKSKNDFFDIKEEKEFINLIPNNAFKKFLISKIKYYMDENSIPKKFISNIIDEKYIKQKGNSRLKNNNFKNIQTKNLEFNNFRENVSKHENLNEYEYLNKKYNRKNREIKEEYEMKKSNLLEENKKLIIRINTLQELINSSKNQMEEKDLQIKEYLSTYDKISSENEKIKKKNRKFRK